jgi:uncharacterized phiE125 gp8 family phage protein
MSMLRLVAAPTGDAVSLAEAKAHVNVDFDDDDALIAAYLDAATDRFAYLNRSLRPCTWALDLDGFHDVLYLPKPPFVAATSVTYLDAAGATQTLAGTAYDARTDSLGQGRISLAYGQQWPQTLDYGECVTVNFTAGYAIGSLPGALRAAILLTIGALYEQKSDVTSAPSFALPFGAEALAAGFLIHTAIPSRDRRR